MIEGSDEDPRIYYHEKVYPTRYEPLKPKVFFDGRCRVGLGFNSVSVILSLWTLAYLIYSIVQKDYYVEKKIFEPIISATVLVIFAIIMNILFFSTERLGFYFYSTPAYLAHWVSIIIFVWIIISNVLLSLVLFYFDRAAGATAYLVVISSGLFFIGIAFAECMLLFWLIRDCNSNRAERKEKQLIEERANQEDSQTTKYEAA